MSDFDRYEAERWKQKALEFERERDEARAEVERLHDALDQFVAWEMGQLDHPIPTRKEMLDVAMAALAGGEK